MEYITLKNSDLNVSRLCMGGCPMGRYGWGEVKEEELIEAVHAATDNGVNFFDTADTYGLGQAEITLGKALGKKRSKMVIGSKFGVRILNGKTVYDNSRAWIQEALEGSLRRLNTDYIDLYQVHYRDGVTPIEEVVESLEIMKSKGYIRYYGLSNICNEDLSELEIYNGKFITFQNEYSLACRKHEQDIMNICDKMDMNIMTWGSLGQGILTGKYDLKSTFDKNDRRSRDIYVNFHGEKLEKNLLIVEELKKIAIAHQKPISSVAIRYILDFLSEAVVLFGAKKPGQVLDNIQGADWHLSDEELKCLEVISK